MKKYFKKSAFLLTALTVVMALTVLPLVSAQGLPTSMTCIPVQQFAQNKTQLECRLRAAEAPYFLVAEVSFPFKITSLIKVSSSYSGMLGSVYPTQIAANTIVISSTDWGSQTDLANVQAVPFDTLSFLLETDQPLRNIKQSFTLQQTQISFLSPNPADPEVPLYQTINPQQSLLFDGSLVLESFTQYVSPGVLQFLRLGISCYEKAPQDCLANMIQNL